MNWRLILVCALFIFCFVAYGLLAQSEGKECGWVFSMSAGEMVWICK